MLAFALWVIGRAKCECAKTLETVPNGPTGRRLIVGGKAVGQVPWQVATSSGCGGTIISENVVLTAAHCSFRAGAHVIGGVMHKSRGSQKNAQKIKVKKVIDHEAYRDASQGKDITVLLLEESFKCDEFAQLACLPAAGSKPVSEDVLRVSGYGMASKTDRGDGFLKYVDIPVDAKPCKYPDHFCAGVTGANVKSACKGDSGGPVVRLKGGRVEVVGVVSFGGDCGKTIIGKYTDVSKFIDWLKTNSDVAPPNPGSTPPTPPSTPSTPPSTPSTPPSTPSTPPSTPSTPPAPSDTSEESWYLHLFIGVAILVVSLIVCAAWYFHSQQTQVGKINAEKPSRTPCKKSARARRRPSQRSRRKPAPRRSRR